MSQSVHVHSSFIHEEPDVKCAIVGGSVDPRVARLAVGALEFGVAIAGAALAGAFLKAAHALDARPFTFHIGLGIAFASTFVPLELAMSRPSLRVDLRPDLSPDRSASVWLLSIAAALAIAGLVGEWPKVTDATAIVTVLIVMLSMLLCQRLANPTLGRLLHDGDRRWEDIQKALARKTFITLGEGPRSISLVNCDAVVSPSIERNVHQALSSIRRSYPEEVLIFAPPHKLELVLALARGLAGIPVAVNWASPCDLGAAWAQRLMPIPGYHIVRLQSAPSILYGSLVKRTVDIAFAFFGLLLSMPLLLVIAALVRRESPGPVFFRQKRVGLRGATFEVMKFRTMYVGPDEANVMQCVRDDRRVTPLGKILRRTSLDELPQLFNILAGDMSIVGPRPHALSHDDYFSSRLEWYFARRYRKPGLTGWAQVNGSRGETPDLQSMQRRVDLDLWYVNNVSLMQDMRIVVKTAKEVFASRHAY